MSLIQDPASGTAQSVKPANTAPTATDNAAVVSISPNSPALTVGQGAGAGTYWYVRCTDGTHTQPTLDVAARAGFVEITDGTNVMPTGDVASRAIYHYVTDGTNILGVIAHPVYVEVTDGTHTMPTMDAAARRGYQTITDGTNSMPTMDTAARRGYFTLTDGTNTAPTMDTAARAAFMQLTDATHGPAAVKAGSTGVAAADPALVVAISPNALTKIAEYDAAGTPTADIVSTGNVLNTLSEREERVLRMRFGVGDDGSEHTLEEVGSEFAVTRERIRQIESKALRKIRHPRYSKTLKAFLG